MTRAEAEAELLARGIKRPSLYPTQRPIGVAEIQQAQTPSTANSYIPAAFEALSRITRQPTPQEQLLEMQVQHAQEQAAARAQQTQALGGTLATAAGANSLVGGGPAAAAPAAPTLLGATSSTGAVGAPAAAAAPATSGLGSLAATAIPVAAAAGATYLGAQGAARMAEGKDPTGLQQAALAPMTGGLSLLANPINNVFGSGKGKDQKQRDSYRSVLQDAGILDDQYAFTLGDGSRISTASNQGLDYADFNVDFGQEGIGNTVGAVNPLAAILAGGTGKGQNDLAGFYTNAVSASDDPLAEARRQYEVAGFDRNSAWLGVDSLDIDEAEKDAFKAGIDSVFGIGG